MCRGINVVCITFALLLASRVCAAPFARGTKVYVEARLGDLFVQRLSPASVDPVTGEFSYETATDNFAVFNVSRGLSYTHWSNRVSTTARVLS